MGAEGAVATCRVWAVRHRGLARCMQGNRVEQLLGASFLPKNTFILTILPSGSQARQEASLSPPSKVVARLAPTALKQKIEADYKAAYFLTGAISREAYDEDCVFTGTEGRKSWGG